MRIKNPFSRKSATPQPAPMTNEEWARQVLDDIATPLVTRCLNHIHQNAK